MKLFLILALLSPSLFAVTPPDQNTVDKWIFSALNITEEQLPDDPKDTWKCEYAVVIDSAFTSTGQTQQIATTKAALKCIRHQCSRMPMLLSEARIMLAAVSDEELARVMKGQGYSQEEIDNALRNRKNPNEEYLNRISTCHEGSPTLRAFAVDSCFVLPFSCKKK